MSLEREVARAAAWGAALDLFRSTPGDLEATKPLADLLVDHGMAEVAPLVLSSGLSEPPDPTSLSWCLGLVLRGMLLEESHGQLTGARRTFDAAEPLLALAAGQPFVSRVRPSAAHVTYVMGELELRGAHPDLAQPLLEVAAKVEPTSEAFLALASIHRQRGDTAAALEALERVIQMSRRSHRPAPEAEALLVAFEIHRAEARLDRAAERLAQALKLALDARERARSDSDQAVAERLLARVLAYYNDKDGARRATRRALEASRSQSRQLTATVLDAAQLALTHGDLSAAREAVREAVDAELSNEDLIYVALWLQLLEFRLGVASNGTVETALAAVEGANGWPSVLRDWAAGRLKDDGLLEAARGPVERTEAMFYVAMRALMKSNDGSALPQLEQVARSAAVELVEVSIARELLLERSGKQLHPELPAGIVIP
jgi:tetratricopeptide (TPR) repeat protein